MNKNNDSRLLVNLIGIPLLLSAIYYGGLFFQCLIFVSIFFSTYELEKMCLLKKINIHIIPLYLFYTYLFLNHLIEINLFNKQSFMIEIIIILSIVILTFELFRNKEKPIENLGVTLLGAIWIGVFLDCIVSIRNMEFGMSWIFIMFVSVWICDSAAFIFGSKFGKRKILERVSPNKTWLGSISGLLSVFIFIFIVSTNQNQLFEKSFVNLFFLTIIFGMISQFGDLVESMIKRQFGVKDSGRSLRGHGGFLDRMDSLMLAAPSLYLYLSYL